MPDNNSRGVNVLERQHARSLRLLTIERLPQRGFFHAHYQSFIFIKTDDYSRMTEQYLVQLYGESLLMAQQP